MIRAGIFVGGRSRRMGGRPKGLLVTDAGETILARWTRLFQELGIPAVLVGECAAYSGSNLQQIRDNSLAKGPLAGLLALLEIASASSVIAVACDMPSVSRPLLERLVKTAANPIVAARPAGCWQPFFAHYEISRVLPVARARAARGLHALHGLLDECRASALELTSTEEAELGDWDTPADVPER